MQFLEVRLNEAKKYGRLEGVILTGLDERSLDIFEQYVNNTGDIQTASLALSHVVPKKFKDTRVDHWIRLYRDLLDTWQLWHQRAKFDMARKDPIPAQVYARCNFCSQPLSMGMIVPRRGGSSAGGNSSGGGGMGGAGGGSMVGRSAMASKGSSINTKQMLPNQQKVSGSIVMLLNLSIPLHYHYLF